MRPRLGKTTSRPVGGETPAEPVSERVALGLVVSLAGGHMDAFSYLLHGGVFANGQTGNYVLLVLSLAAGDIRGAVRYLVPIGAFLAGHCHGTTRDGCAVRRRSFSCAALGCGF